MTALQKLDHVPTEAEVDAVVGVLEGLADGLRELFPGRNPAGVPLSLEYVLAMLEQAAQELATVAWLTPTPQGEQTPLDPHPCLVLLNAVHSDGPCSSRHHR